MHTYIHTYSEGGTGLPMFEDHQEGWVSFQADSRVTLQAPIQERLYPSKSNFNILVWLLSTKEKIFGRT